MINDAYNGWLILVIMDRYFFTMTIMISSPASYSLYIASQPGMPILSEKRTSPTPMDGQIPGDECMVTVNLCKSHMLELICIV